MLRRNDHLFFRFLPGRHAAVNHFHLAETHLLHHVGGHGTWLQEIHALTNLPVLNKVIQAPKPLSLTDKPISTRPMNPIQTPQQAQDFIHGYVKNLCSLLVQVESVAFEKPMELTVTATEGHRFKVDLNELHGLMLADGAPEYSDADMYYYFARKVNEALGYTSVWPIDRPWIFPVIKNTAFIHGLDLTSPEDKVLFQPLSGDLWCCYAVLRDDVLHYITEHHLRYTLKLQSGELHPLVLENLNTAQDDNLVIGPLSDSVWRIHHPVRYADDAGVLLLAPVWEHVKEHLDTGQVAVCVPAPDCLLFCNGEDEEAVKELQETCLQMYREAAEPLSKCLLWWNPKVPRWQLEPYQEMPDIEKIMRMNRLMGWCMGEQD